MYGLIYLITCLVNGKKYVGQTTKTVEKRFKEHVRRKKSLISKAIHEFGVENFTVEVLEECETSEQLNARECYWIAYFDCISPKGYNCTNGGQGGWHHTPEACARIAAANSGENHPMYGRHHTPESKALIGASSKGRRPSEETKAKLSAAQPEKHAVICIETGEIFDSVAAAARRYNINRSQIIIACQQHQRMVDGKHFWYLKDYNNATEIVIPPPGNTIKRKVICLETGTIFETIRAAAKWLGMVHGAVSRACRIHYAAGGYHFRYLEEYQNSQA